MKSNKPLIIVFIISIIILLGYFVKTNNGFIKTNNGFIETTNNLIKQPNRPCYDGVLNNTDKVNDNNTLLGETPQLKQFSTFGSNLELFNKPTSSFYKKEPYVFLQQSIKEGAGEAIDNTCNDSITEDLHDILFPDGASERLARTCSNKLSELKQNKQSYFDQVDKKAEDVTAKLKLNASNRVAEAKANLTKWTEDRATEVDTNAKLKADADKARSDAAEATGRVW